MRRKSRKLRIDRETVRNLSGTSLADAVGGVISDASNCQRCRTIAPCIETGTCWEPTIDGCGPTLPSFDCVATQQTC